MIWDDDHLYLLVNYPSKLPIPALVNPRARRRRGGPIIDATRQ
jgi:hypothetical protein